MATEIGPLSLAWLALAGASLGGCLSVSIAGDVATVGELSHTAGLARLADRAVDPAIDEDARPLLGDPLDADRAVRIALLNNRELRATLRELGIARGRVIQAGLPPNPVFEAEVLPERNTTIELRVEYDLTAALLTPLRAQATKAELHAERFRAAASVVALGYEVRAAFYGVQASQQRVAIGLRALDTAAASRDVARALFDAGNIPPIATSR